MYIKNIVISMLLHAITTKSVRILDCVVVFINKIIMIFKLESKKSL